MAFRAPVQTTNAVVIYMDDESHRNLGQPWFGAWDRAVHAELVERLTACGVKALAFDVLFDVPDTNRPASDQRFARAIKAHGKVILAGKMEPILLQGQITGVKPVLPADEFRNAAAAWGLVEAGGGDKIIRRHYQGDDRTPSLVWKLATLTMDKPPDASTARWLNYYGPPGTVPFYSFWEIISNSIPAANFTNKVVFVGALYSLGFTGGKGTDDFKTPYTWRTERVAPGVEVNATTYLNLFRGDWLRELSSANELLLLVGFGLSFGCGLIWVRPWIAAALAFLGFFGILLWAVWLVWRQNCWFPWLVVGAVQLPTAFCWAVVWNTRKLYREKEVLEERLATAQSASSILAPGQPAPQPARGSSEGPTQVGPPILDFTKGSPRPRLTDLAPRIADHDLIRLIGQGAYGEVWLARDVIGSFHAAKIVYRRTFSSDGPFDREFKGIQKFTPISRSHPGFVHVLQVGRNDEAGYFYYVMEAGDDEVTGQKIDPATYSPNDLAKEIDKRGKLPLPECLQLSLDLAAALDYLHHQQLIHRDIKPSNIIFVNGLPKLADIGLVTDIADTGREVTYLGTAGYIPPEGPGTPAADVYSLGKVIYEASMGRQLRNFPDLPTTLIERPDHRGFLQLHEIILLACETNLRIRYQTMADLRADLLRLKARLEAEPKT